MMHAGMMAALVVSGMAGVGMMANEASHGQVAEMMGLGHHHMADSNGYHCAEHSGAHGAHHAEHMHGGNFTAHPACPGGIGMHGNQTMGMDGMGSMM